MARLLPCPLSLLRLASHKSDTETRAGRVRDGMCRLTVNLALLPVTIRVHLVHASLFCFSHSGEGWLSPRSFVCLVGVGRMWENSQPFPPCGVAKASAPFRSLVWHKPNSHLGDSFRTPGLATWNSTLSRKRVFPLSGAKRATLYCRGVVASELTFERGSPISLDCSRVEWERRDIVDQCMCAPTVSYAPHRPLR